MQNGAKLLGHSIHPVLIVFPLGLLATSVVFDLVNLIFPNTAFPIVAYWMIAAGLIGGGLSAVFGWIDWFAIPAGTRAKSVGLVHGLLMAATLVLFVGSFYFRNSVPTAVSSVAVVLSLLAGGLALVGGWFGGELVERLGVGVHSGANANAPSSLTTDIPEARGSGAAIKKT